MTKIIQMSSDDIIVVQFVMLRLHA